MNQTGIVHATTNEKNLILVIHEFASFIWPQSRFEVTVVCYSQDIPDILFVLVLYGIVDFSRIRCVSRRLCRLFRASFCIFHEDVQ